MCLTLLFVKVYFTLFFLCGVWNTTFFGCFVEKHLSLCCCYVVVCMHTHSSVGLGGTKSALLAIAQHRSLLPGMSAPHNTSTKVGLKVEDKVRPEQAFCLHAKSRPTSAEKTAAASIDDGECRCLRRVVRQFSLNPPSLHLGFPSPESSGFEGGGA